MIRLIKSEDVELINKIDNSLSVEYLNTLINNMNEYIYVSTEKSSVDGYMVCFNDGNNIIIKNLYYANEEILSNLVRHLDFNSNKDVIIKSNEVYKNRLIQLGFVDEGSQFRKPFKQLSPNNVSIIEYYEQNEEFKRKLLNQINEPLWGGAKYLYNKILNNELMNGKVYILFDSDRNHIISFLSLSDFDDIINTNLKPWIGCVYTFRPYRGNRFSEKLIMHTLKEAKKNNIDYVYLSSDHKGLYEKYGFEFVDTMTRTEGYTTQVFKYDTRKLDNQR